VLDVAFALVVIALTLLVASLELGPSALSQPARLRPRSEGRPRSPLSKPPVTLTSRTADVVGECAEAVFTAHRLAGDLSAAQYRHGMAVLAAQDAVRRPLVVPPARDI
jgi:hypothetical protein